MPIFATLISRGSTVLSEYNAGDPNFGSIARRLIEQIPTQVESKKSYSHQTANFHYIVEAGRDGYPGLIYLCMTDQALGYRVPYNFLFEVARRFRATFGDKVNTASSMSLNDSFARILKERMDFFSNDRNADKINKVKHEIDEVKTQMVTNIEKVLARGEQIEVLVDKTEDLQYQSATFKRKTTTLKRKLWWKNAKLCAILICIALIVIAGIIIGLLTVFRPGIFSGIHSGGGNSDSSTSTTTTTTSGSSTSDSSTSTGSALSQDQFSLLASPVFRLQPIPIWRPR